MLIPTREEMNRDDLIVTMRGLAVSLEKSHTKGILKGIVTKEIMHFSSFAEAIDWMERVNENNKRGIVDYSVNWVENLSTGDVVTNV